MTPEDIELLFQSRDQHQGSVSVRDEGDDTISDEETSFRVLQLKGVLPAVHNAWISGSEELDYIAEKLADGSRDGWFCTSSISSARSMLSLCRQRLGEFP